MWWVYELLQTIRHSRVDSEGDRKPAEKSYHLCMGQLHRVSSQKSAMCVSEVNVYRLLQEPKVYLVAYAGASFPIAELFRSRGM